MKILSKAEREAEAKNRAQAAVKKAKAPQKDTNTAEKIKEQLQRLGYQINDELALQNLPVKDGKLQFEQIRILSERGAISLNTDELEKPSPAPQKPAQTQTQPKIFSISEAEEAEPVVQKQIQATPTAPTAPTPPTTEQRLEGLKKSLEQKTKASQQPAPQKKNQGSTDKRDEKNKEPAWVKNYPEALKQWCDKNVDKKTGQPKRKITEIRSGLDDTQQPSVDIEIAPISPIAHKRGDHGAIYTIKKSPQPEKLDVTVKNKEPGQPLNYDYFYALVKAAHDNGADTIEFNNIRTPEFRDKLLTAALQFKMKLKNPPGVINLEAEHLQTIPPGCRQYLEKHNEAVKKALRERGKEIIPEKGQKYGTGPRAEDRTHAEIEAIESEQMMEKYRRADKRRQEWEEELNSPSTAEYDQHPERGNNDPAKRRQPKPNKRTYSPISKPGKTR